MFGGQNAKAISKIDLKQQAWQNLKTSAAVK